ncbi:hypothetical protein ACMXYV_04840 [Neptuniibacter sp. SY11_33]|uniref:hypothetical protein n=1 Tax=Neptuniibacter sp. SY11_33 TaxID=3398215 RepID=UPI0039F5CDD7
MTRVDIHIAHSLEEVSKPSSMDPSLRWEDEVYRDLRRHSCEGRNLILKAQIMR